MSLLNVPDGVIEKWVLLHLAWNDLLRLRRVCKATNVMVQGYVKLHPGLAPEIEIRSSKDGDSERSLKAFVRMNIPSTRIFLNYQNAKSFYQNSLREVKTLAPTIKHLRVTNVSLFFFSWPEKRFLEGLANLESFEATYVSLDDPMACALRKRNVLLFAGFRKLRSLKLDIITVTRTDPIVSLSLTVQFLLESLPKLRNLEHIRLPVLPGEIIKGLATEGLTLIFRSLDACIRGRKPNPLKLIDLTNISSLGSGYSGVQAQNALFQLLRTCASHNVKLLNVRTSLLQSVEGRQLIKFNFKPPVTSLINLPCLETSWMYNLPHLEKLEIRRIFQCHHSTSFRKGRPFWPKLKVLSVAPFGGFSAWEAYTLFQILFQNARHPALEELSLDFVCIPEVMTGTIVQYVVNACPNLKRLSLVNWNGSNAELAKLWKSLQKLEEIKLVMCQQLATEAFLGVGESRPVFLKLKKLNKLSLEGLTCMPNVKDDLFEKVIRFLPLKQLILTSRSSSPISSITRRGIESLLRGPFANSIQKFPFQGWSLGDLSAEEFEKLGRRFRSSDIV